MGTEVVKRSRRQQVRRDHPEIAWTLLRDFNAWRAYCIDIRRRRATGRVADYVASDERLDLLERLSDWCRDREIEPRLWLYLLFRARRWTWAPRLEEAHLMSERQVSSYQHARGLDGYRRHVFGEPPAQRHFDPNLELSPTNEARKQVLLQQPDGPLSCMAQMVERTYGYHPKSDHCRQCPLGPQCAEQLSRWCDFDVIALRLGTLTKHEAIQAAIKKATQ